jgi:signal transduction histidine kinase
MTEKSKILIVDDRPENLIALKKSLEDLEVEFFTATSGDEALKIILHHQFALLILDVMMPGMDGYELAELIRSQNETKEVPLIFLTAMDSSKSSMFKGYQSGAVDFLFKPIEEEIIRNKAKVFIQLDKQKIEIQKVNKELQTSYDKLEERIEERTQELKQSKELAEKHSKAKTDFLSSMSHELRTPMNAILGFSQLMREDRKNPLSDFNNSRLDQILKAGDHLLHLINEVLDLTQVESGKATVSLEPINIAELTLDILNVIRPMAKKFDISLIDQITADDKTFVIADKIRLKQVLLNLISNGIKYNRKKGKVTLSLEKQGSDEINILVTDTGMGLSKEQIENIFEPFERLGANTYEIEGTGIGMTISKKLIELMNGRIKVKDLKGKGLQVSVCFPSCEPPALDKENNSSLQASPPYIFSKEKFTVLYIEDNKANVLLVEDILSEFEDVQLLISSQSQIGLDLAYAHQPNLILLDINLPEMDGLEVLKRLKNMEETCDIPVIAISANATSKDIERAKNLGFKDYITKPIDISNFKRVLTGFLNSHS